MHDIATMLLNPEIIWDTIGKREKKEKKRTKIGKSLIKFWKNFKWEYLQILITVFLICIFHFIQIANLLPDGHGPKP